MSEDELRALLAAEVKGFRAVPAADAESTLREVLKTTTMIPGELYDELASSGATCLGLGPEVRVTTGAARKGQARPSAWWAREGQLLLSLNVAALPDLWVEVEPTSEGIAQAIAALRPDEAAPERTFRFLFGLLPDFVEDFMNVENRLTLDPFCEGLPLRLGSAAPNDGRSDCFDDPLHISQFETLLSRSRMAITALHQQVEDGSLTIGAVEYRPAAHGSVVARWNDARGSDWPLDLPLDVLGAIGFCQGVSFAQVEAWIAEPEGRLPPAFALLAAFAILTAPGPGVAEDETIVALLRKHARSADPDVRGLAGELAAMAELDLGASA